MPRHGARALPHLCKPPPQATYAKKTWGVGGRLDNDALQAENREGGLRIGHAPLASPDAVARRNNAGRIFAIRRSGARRASNASLFEYGFDAMPQTEHSPFHS